MLLVLNLFLLLLNTLLVVIQYHRYDDWVRPDKLNDFPEITTHKSPLVLMQKLISNFSLIAEDYDPRSALDFF